MHTPESRDPAAPQRLVVGQTLVVATGGWEDASSPEAWFGYFAYVQRVAIRTPGSSEVTALRVLAESVIPTGRSYTVMNAWDCGDGFHILEMDSCSCIRIVLEGAQIAQLPITNAGTPVEHALDQ